MINRLPFGHFFLSNFPLIERNPCQPSKKGLELNINQLIPILVKKKKVLRAAPWRSCSLQNLVVGLTHPLSSKCFPLSMVSSVSSRVTAIEVDKISLLDFPNSTFLKSYIVVISVLLTGFCQLRYYRGVPYILISKKLSGINRNK